MEIGKPMYRRGRIVLQVRLLDGNYGKWLSE